MRLDSTLPIQESLSKDGPLQFRRLLFVRPEPNDRDAIRTFRDVRKPLSVKKVDPATFAKLGRAIHSDQGADGCVFVGHGKTEKGLGTLVFVREQRALFQTFWLSHMIAGHLVADTLGEHKALRYACIFACESAWSDELISFKDSVVGLVLHRTGFSFVVGAQAKLDSSAAECFFNASIEAIKGPVDVPLDLAFGIGRNHVAKLPIEPPITFSCMDWWVPVLYVTRDLLQQLEKTSLSPGAAPVLMNQPDPDGDLSPIEPLGFAVSPGKAVAAAVGRTLSGLWQ
jgi:hypothetical protein